MFYIKLYFYLFFTNCNDLWMDSNHHAVGHYWNRLKANSTLRTRLQVTDEEARFSILMVSDKHLQVSRDLVANTRTPKCSPCNCF